MPDVRRITAGPRSPGWGWVQRAVACEARAAALAVAEMLAAPADDRAVAAAESFVAVLRELCEVARHLDVGEAVIEEACARAVAADRAAHPRGRGHHLRAVT